MSAQTNQTPQLETALWYASLGWSVVPTHKVVRTAEGTACTCPRGAACTSKGKHPAVAWERYQRAPATEQQIRAWFTGHFASYGVGIITGAVSGFFVIDVDEGPGKAGGDVFNDLQFLHGDVPFTVRARTGGGGRHILLRHPKDVWIHTGRNVLGPGVDVRGDGGFIVAAPSLHESGRYYLWDDAAHPRNTPLAAAPAWVIEMAEGPPPDAQGNRAPSTGAGEIVRDTWGKVVDGRERYMIGIICGCIASMKRATGALPTAEAVVAEAWPTYERNVKARGLSLDDENRGIALLRQRVAHFLGRVERGQWKPEANKQEAPPFGAAERRPPPAILTIAELLAMPPPQWLVAGLVPEQSLIVPYGPPKSGKSFLMMSLGLHVSDGRDWFGHAVQQGAVVYVMGEGIGGMSNRLRAMLARYEMDPSIPFFIIRRAVNLRDPNEVKALEASIRARIGDLPLRLLVIDTLARAMPGADENSAQETGTVIAVADDLKETFACTVALVHHEGKDETRGARGTSALRGAWDAAYQIVSRGKRMTMTVVDQKEAEAGQMLRFNMEEVAVGIGRTSLVPVLDETPGHEAGHLPGQTGHRRDIGGQSGIALQVLRDALASPEAVAVPWFSEMPTGTGDLTGVHVEIWRRRFYERMPTITAEARKKAFQRAVENLTRLRFIGVRDPWVWLAAVVKPE